MPVCLSICLFVCLLIIITAICCFVFLLIRLSAGWTSLISDCHAIILVTNNRQQLSFWLGTQSHFLHTCYLASYSYRSKCFVFHNSCVSTGSFTAVCLEPSLGTGALLQWLSSSWMPIDRGTTAQTSPAQLHYLPPRARPLLFPPRLFQEGCTQQLPRRHSTPNHH